MPTIASQAAKLLQAKSFAPQQRAAQAPAIRRVWVYLDGLKSDIAVTRVLHRLERGGIDDAEAMPPEANGRQISLGLFSDRKRADHRAQAVRVMGLQAQDHGADGTGYRLLAGSHAAEQVRVRTAEGRVGPGARRRHLADQRAAVPDERDAEAVHVAGAGCSGTPECSSGVDCAAGGRPAAVQAGWGRAGAVHRARIAGCQAPVRALRATGPVQCAAPGACPGRPSGAGLAQW